MNSRRLVKNSGGSYTRTLTDGTQITFNSGGYETATIDLNNQHITFAYNGSNQISTITDNYSNITTFSYSGGYLQTIKDPAGRIATFTHSSANLTGVTLPDGEHLGLFLRLGRPVDPDHRSAFAHSNDRL